MTATLSQFEIALLLRLKDSLPVCERPFAEMARALGVEQTRVIDAVSGLRACVSFRRFRRPYLPLAWANGLAGDRSMFRTINSIPLRMRSSAAGVSKLLPESHYNLWFTLQAGSLSEST